MLYEIPDEYKPVDKGPSQAPYQFYDFLMQSGLVMRAKKCFLSMVQGEVQKRWEGILRESGIEVDDGIVRAPSTAVVYCIKKTGSQRETANGWTMWKTEEGLTLDAVYQKAKELQERTPSMPPPKHTHCGKRRKLLACHQAPGASALSVFLALA